MGKKILITGGSGLLALNWALFSRSSHAITLVLHDRIVKLKGVETVVANLSGPDYILQLFQQVKPDLVIHTAGLTNVDLCEKSPSLAYSINTKLASDVSEACVRSNISFVHISTDHLYNGTMSLLSELAPVSPLNVYGDSKARAEMEITGNNKNALIIRTNFFGWGPGYRKSFSDNIINALRQNKTIDLFEDVYYTPILIESLIKCIYRLIEEDAKGIFNVVSDERISKLDFGLRLADIFSLDRNLIRKVSVHDIDGLTNRPSDMSLSNLKTAQVINGSVSILENDLRSLLAQEESGFINEIKEL